MFRRGWISIGLSTTIRYFGNRFNRAFLMVDSTFGSIGSAERVGIGKANDDHNELRGTRYAGGGRNVLSRDAGPGKAVRKRSSAIKAAETCIGRQSSNRHCR